MTARNLVRRPGSGSQHGSNQSNIAHADLLHALHTHALPGAAPRIPLARPTRALHLQPTSPRPAAHPAMIASADLPEPCRRVSRAASSASRSLPMVSRPPLWPAHMATAVGSK